MKLKSLQLHDITFIQNKIIDNHPAYILDPTFKRRLHSTNDILSFIKSQEDIHFYIHFYNEVLEESTLSGSFDFSIEDNIPLIRIPTFEKCIPEDLLRFTKSVFHNKNIQEYIIDIRGNTGGNSLYVDRFFRYIYNQEMMNYIYHKKYKNVTIHWRNSEDVIKRMQYNYYKYGDETKKEFINILRSSEEDIWSINMDTNKIVPYPHDLLENKIVYIVIDKDNASSALDLIDIFKIAHPNQTYLVGEESTNYDTDYMDTMSFKLPSRTGELIIPMRKIEGRFRGDKDKYYPDILI
jgi:hypothetical protein